MRSCIWQLMHDRGIMCSYWTPARVEFSLLPDLWDSFMTYWETFYDNGIWNDVCCIEGIMDCCIEFHIVWISTNFERNNILDLAAYTINLNIRLEPDSLIKLDLRYRRTFHVVFVAKLQYGWVIYCWCWPMRCYPNMRLSRKGQHCSWWWLITWLLM